MARPRSGAYEERRALILDLAAELFAAKRYHGASLRDLRRLAKMTKGQIYHYYPHKDELLFDIIHRYLREYQAVVQSLPEKLRPGLDVLELLTSELLSLNLQRPSYLTVFRNDEASLPAKFRPTVTSLRRSIMRGVEKVFSESCRSVPDWSPEKTAALYLDAIGVIGGYPRLTLSEAVAFARSAFLASLVSSLEPVLAHC